MKEGFHIRKLTRNKHHYSKNTVFITLKMKGLGGAVSRMGAGSVSYTHLRAHET